MAEFVYIDETGSPGTPSSKQPFLTLVAILIEEDKVQALSEQMRGLAWQHIGWLPDEFEFHGHEVWGSTKWWKDKTPPELIAAYEDVIGLLEHFDLRVAHSSINKAKLTERYEGAADRNAYRLALQFLLEKVDRLGQGRKIIVADEAKEQELRAVQMVAELQQWGGGEVPGATLKTVIDSLHFVRSQASSGVQLADMVAYVIQRRRRNAEAHPEAAAALQRLADLVYARTRTWREAWPS